MSWFVKRDKTTRHSYFEERLSAYIDGELTPREQESVKQHLATCTTCRWNLSTLEQTVQRASELPTVQVPRAFTIPASVEPVRPTSRGWTLLPVLQGATALVALLLVFAVTGDVMLTGFGARSRSELSTVHDGAAVVETTVVEEAWVEKEAEVTVVAEQSSEAEASLALEMPEPSPAEPEGEMMLQMAPSVAMTATGTAWADLEAAVSGELDGTDTASARAAEESAVLTAPAMAAAEVVSPTLTPLPSLEAPETRAALAGPTSEVMAAKAPEQSESETQTLQERGLRAPAIGWLRMGEYVLGVALILLIGTTLGVMVWRRMVG
jgi:hypothetical protein